jgi:hypothetical protein
MLNLEYTKEIIMLKLEPAIGAVTQHTPVAELREIALEFKEFFVTEYGVESGMERFHSTEEFFFVKELLKYHVRNPYKVAVYLNGKPCGHILKTNEMEDSYTANAFGALLHLKRVYLKMDRSFNNNRYKAQNIVKFADMLKDIHCDAQVLVRYNAGTAPMIDKTMSKYEALWKNGKTFDKFGLLHCSEADETRRDFQIGFENIPYLASIKTTAWGDDIGPDTVADALEVLSGRIRNAKTLCFGTRDGVLTDGKTDLNKVHAFLGKIKDWMVQSGR